MGKRTQAHHPQKFGRRACERELQNNNLRRLEIYNLLRGDVSEHFTEVFPGACNCADAEFLGRGVGIHDGRTEGYHIHIGIFGREDTALKAAVCGAYLDFLVMKPAVNVLANLQDIRFVIGLPAVV